MKHYFFWLIGQRDGKANTGVVIVPLGAERWVMFPSRTFVKKSLVLFVCPFISFVLSSVLCAPQAKRMNSTEPVLQLFELIFKYIYFGQANILLVRV